MPVGLILFAHGARDPRWTEPFTRLRDKLAARIPDTHVRLAFLEHGKPDLLEAATDLVAMRADSIRVVPMFFGRGGHLREDFPRQLASAKARLPNVHFEVTAAAGEDEVVLDALVDFALRALPEPNLTR